MPGGLAVRSFISKFEIGLGVVLLVVTIAHMGWCEWSVPRHGVVTPHGLETRTCNWGTALAGLFLGGIALVTLVSGAIGHKLRRRVGRWYLAQLPAATAWAWLTYGLIYSLFIYEG